MNGLESMDSCLIKKTSAPCCSRRSRMACPNDHLPRMPIEYLVINKFFRDIVMPVHCRVHLVKLLN